MSSASNRNSAVWYAPEMTLYSLFTKYDENNDGQLNEKELMNLLCNEMGLTLDEVEIYSYLLDKDGNGLISFDEFKEWYNSDEELKTVRDNSRYQIIKNAIELFKKFDVDQSYALDREELQKVILEFGGDPKSVDEALRQLDADNNGKISFQEFLKWLNWVPVDQLFF